MRTIRNSMASLGIGFGLMVFGGPVLGLVGFGLVIVGVCQLAVAVQQTAPNY